MDKKTNRLSKLGKYPFPDRIRGGSERLKILDDKSNWERAGKEQANIGWVRTGSIIQMLKESRVCRIEKEKSHVLIRDADGLYEIQASPEMLRYLIWELEQLADEMEDGDGSSEWYRGNCHGSPKKEGSVK